MSQHVGIERVRFSKRNGLLGSPAKEAVLLASPARTSTEAVRSYWHWLTAMCSKQMFLSLLLSKKKKKKNSLLQALASLIYLSAALLSLFLLASTFNTMYTLLLLDIVTHVAKGNNLLMP